MVTHDPTGQGVRVLIVEDETLVSMMLTDLVEDEGYEVVGPAIDAEEALRMAEDRPPQIAIVDVSLHGGHSGLDVGAELMQRHGLALILISGHGGVADWPEVKALAPAAVLRKPCLPAQVFEALRVAGKARLGGSPPG